MGFSFTTALTVANSPCMKALRSRMGPTGRATAVAAVTDDVAAFDMIVEDAFTGAFAVAVAAVAVGAASSTTSSTASFDSGNPPAGMGGGGSVAFTGNPPAGMGGGGRRVAFTGNPPAGMGGGGSSPPADKAAFAGNPPAGMGGGGGKDSLEG